MLKPLCHKIHNCFHFLNIGSKPICRWRGSYKSQKKYSITKSCFLCVKKGTHLYTGMEIFYVCFFLDKYCFHSVEWMFKYHLKVLCICFLFLNVGLISICRWRDSSESVEFYSIAKSCFQCVIKRTDLCTRLNSFYVFWVFPLSVVWRFRNYFKTLWICFCF